MLQLGSIFGLSLKVELGQSFKDVAFLSIRKPSGAFPEIIPRIARGDKPIR